MPRVGSARASLDELSHLTAAAREAHDPSLEASALRARHQLGRDLLASATPSDARAISPVRLDPADPFPDVRGRPPEIGRDELDLEVLRGALAHHGCVLVHGFFPSQTMANLRDQIDAIADGFERWMASGQTITTPSFFEPFSGPDAVLPLALRAMCGPLGTYYAADAPRAFLHLIDAFEATGLASLLVDYMQEPVLLGLEKTSLRRVPPGIPTAWHQDGIRFGRDVGLVNVWVALQECGIDAPTLGIVPTRTREILPLDEGSAVPWEIGENAMAVVTRDVEPIELVLDAGDAIMFDEMLIHSTITRDGMTKPRYCADAWFFPVSQFPADLYKPLAFAIP
jgi:hypothetical protein